VDSADIYLNDNSDQFKHMLLLDCNPAELVDQIRA